MLVEKLGNNLNSRKLIMSNELLKYVLILFCCYLSGKDSMILMTCSVVTYYLQRLIQTWVINSYEIRIQNNLQNIFYHISYLEVWPLHISWLITYEDPAIQWNYLNFVWIILCDIYIYIWIYMFVCLWLEFGFLSKS